MPVIATNFLKINVEKSRGAHKNVKINNNLSIKSVEKMNLSLGEAQQEGVRFIFEYTTKYEPDAATMNMEGEVLFVGSKEKIDDILQKWENKEEINQEIMTSVMNSALTKASIKALDFSQDMNLPAPVKLPKVTKKQKKGENEQSNSTQSS